MEYRSLLKGWQANIFPGLERYAYLAYRRVRPALGLPLGFIIIYAALNPSIGAWLPLLAFGFWSVYLYCDCYNDYWDFKDDVKNKRLDKMTVSGVLGLKQMKLVSWFFLLVGLAALSFFNVYIFLVGLFQGFLGYAYSHPSLRLKKYNLAGYLAIGLPFILFPFAFNSFLGLGLFSVQSLLLSAFFFTQYIYILCQKDSTDLKDSDNLFLSQGWRKSGLITLAFASLASLSLFLLSFGSALMMTVWVLNSLAKGVNLSRILNKKIDRKLRSRLVSLEYVTPFLAAAGVLIG